LIDGRKGGKSLATNRKTAFLSQFEIKLSVGYTLCVKIFLLAQINIKFQFALERLGLGHGQPFAIYRQKFPPYQLESILGDVESAEGS
jgi:hypothetical protein